jgi:hypothetical protein
MPFIVIALGYLAVSFGSLIIGLAVLDYITKEK